MSIRWQYIRAQAAAIRAHYVAETRVPAPDLLPLDDVLDGYLLSAFDDPSLDPRINGELNPVIGSIRLRPGMSPEKRRFIIAHELGHFVLEHAATLYEDDETTIDERASGGGDQDAGVLRAYNTRERHETRPTSSRSSCSFPRTFSGPQSSSLVGPRRRSARGLESHSTLFAHRSSMSAVLSRLSSKDRHMLTRRRAAPLTTISRRP